MELAVEMKDVSYYYQTKREKKEILNDVNYAFGKGTLYAVMGRSGAGKTTTLSLLGALDVPSSGAICFEGRDIRDVGYCNYRRNNVGIVFQAYNLLPYFSVIENVEAAMEIAGAVKDGRRKKAVELLEKVGIPEEYFDKKISYLSGGEQQRVAIARAAVTDSTIILADEPTGNLDETTGMEIIKLFQRMAHEEGKCVIVVTHSRIFAEEADVVLKLEAGKLNKLA